MYEIFNVAQQEQIRFEKLSKEFDLDYDYLKEKVMEGDNDIVAIAYDSILKEVSALESSKNTILDYVYTYANYSDTSYDLTDSSKKDCIQKRLHKLLKKNLNNSDRDKVQFILDRI